MNIKRAEAFSVAVRVASLLAEKVFAEAGWTWQDDHGRDYQPTVSQIEATYRRLVQEMDSWESGTGRLVVQRDELHGLSFLIRLGDYSADLDGDAA